MTDSLAMPAAPRILSVEERRAVVQQAVRYYTAMGYQVTNQTDDSAQLVRPKRFSCLIATLTLCFPIFTLIYIFVYMAMRDSTMHIAVDSYGNVSYNCRVPVRKGRRRSRSSSARSARR
jgi:hypothetical protein